MFSIYRQFEVETDGFTLNLATASRVELWNIKFVTDWFLETASGNIKNINPGYQAKFRKHIAYLAELQERQAKADVETIELLESETLIAKELLELANNRPIHWEIISKKLNQYQTATLTTGI